LKEKEYILSVLGIYEEYIRRERNEVCQKKEQLYLSM
jgi:hypothetical protein